MTAGSYASNRWNSAATTDPGTSRRTDQENVMVKRSTLLGWTPILLVLVALSVMPSVPRVQAQSAHKVLGGPHGVVKSNKGDLLEGMMVQLIAAKNAVRTTVYSDADGRYEFPRLEAGTYTLRIAQPREFRPFMKDKVEISGPTALEDIVLSRLTNGEVLPHTPEIAAQMTGTEWLMSLSGTGDEKKLLTVNCNWCHSYQQIF